MDWTLVLRLHHTLRLAHSCQQHRYLAGFPPREMVARSRPALTPRTPYPRSQLEDAHSRLQAYSSHMNVEEQIDGEKRRLFFHPYQSAPVHRVQVGLTICPAHVLLQSNSQPTKSLKTYDMRDLPSDAPIMRMLISRPRARKTVLEPSQAEVRRGVEYLVASVLARRSAGLLT